MYPAFNADSFKEESFKAFRNTPIDEQMAIFSDSDWVMRAALDQPPVGQERGMKSADEKTVDAGKDVGKDGRLGKSHENWP